MRKRTLLFSFCLLSALSSCGPQKEEKVIYASFAPIAEFAKGVVGNHYEVKCLTPSGGEPHDHEITPKQVVGIEKSSLLLVNGLGMESYLSSLSDKVLKKTLVLSKGMDIRQIGGVDDPHIWLSPRLAYRECEKIADKVIELDPENQKEYEANLASMKDKFLTVDSAYQTACASFTQKHVLVAHAAFGYLCDAYGLSQLYVSGLSPDAEPTSKQLGVLLNEVKKYSLTTIFYEESVSGDIALKIAKETGLKTDTLETMETDEGEGDYFSKSLVNLAKLKEACS